MTLHHMRFTVPLLVGLLFAGGAAADAQPAGVESELAEAKTLYDAGRFGEAIPKLLAVVAQLRTLEREKIRMGDAHFLLGLSYFAVRDEASALDNFRQALVLDPDRTADPEIFSPRIVSLFERARADATATRLKEEERRRPLESGVLPPTRVGPTPAAPDAWINLSVGSRVRLQLNHSNQRVEGSLLSLSDQSFMLLGSESRSVSFPRPIVERVEISRGRKGHWVRGLIAGCALGVLIGAVEPPTCTNGVCGTRASNISDYSLGFGMFGALLGALYKTDRWIDVPTDRLVNVAPQLPPSNKQP
jgi:hypothetical protein